MVQHALILAGGSGTRLWPASISRLPKPFLDLGFGQSLFGLTLERAMDLGIAGYILVATHQSHLRTVLAECRRVAGVRRFPADRLLIIPEPESRGTAPAIALACRLLSCLNRGAETLLVLPADQRIEPLPALTADVRRAALLANDGWLVTFGVPPTRPETGYGYIHAGEGLGGGFRVIRFKEKPDPETAETLLVEGNHYWNSGMFVYRADRFLEELTLSAPEIARPLLAMRFNIYPGRSGRPARLRGGGLLARVYASLPSISVDYALMERTSRCAMVQVTFGWSDVGSWDEVASWIGRSGERNQELEKGRAPVFALDSEGNFVHSDIPVALVDVHDYVIVVKNGVLLLCRRGQSQRVRQLVEEVHRAGQKRLL